MKMKKEYLILAAVIAALSLYLILHQSDNVHYELPSLAVIPQKSISKVEITKAEKTITLTKKSDKWRINEEQYPADEDAVNRILDTLDDLSVTALISESENYVRYELDEKNRIHIKAYKGDDIIRDFYIGKTAPSFNHTFIRLNKQSEVYHAQDNFRSRFDQTVDALRDKTVLAFNINDIQEILIEKGEQPLAFSKKQLPVEVKTDAAKTEEPAPSAPETRPVWQDSSGKELEDAAVNRYLFTLSTLKCKAYRDVAKDGLKNPIYTVTLKGVEPCTFSIFAGDDPDAEDYPAISSQNDYVFTLEKSRMDTLMKTFDKTEDNKS